MKRFQTLVAVSEPGRRGHVATEDFEHQRECTVAPAGLFVRWPQTRVALWILPVAISVLSSAVVPACAQDSSGQGTSQIAKQAQNPIANVISVPIENDFNPQTGINKEDSYVLQFKPVVPFKLSNDWNLITRTIIPVIQVPDLSPTVNGTSGLGDVQTSFFLSPARVGKVIWGAGPVISFPTATEDILGTKKVSIGPTAVVLSIQGHWLFGTLVQNLFSVAGPSARPDVNQMLLQPFVNYNMRHGWYLVSSPVITSNWEVNSDNRWTVPLGGGGGKIVHFGKLPVTHTPNSFETWSAPTARQVGPQDFRCSFYSQRGEKNADTKSRSGMDA